MTLDNLTLAQLLFVCQRMRDRDWEEVSATNDFTREDFAAHVWQTCGGTSGVSFCASDEHGIPVAVFGWSYQYEGHYSLWFFATQEWAKVRLSVTKFAIRTVIPYLFENGMNVGQCLSLSSYPEIHKWLEMLGAKKDCELRKMGKKCQNFTRFIWEK